MRVLVAYNGTLASKFALIRGILKVKEHGGKLIILAFDRNICEGLESGLRKNAVVKGSFLPGNGRGERRDVRISLIATEGSPEHEIPRYARDENIDMVFSPHHYDSIADGIPCEVCIIPHPVPDTVQGQKGYGGAK